MQKRKKKKEKKNIAMAQTTWLSFVWARFHRRLGRFLVKRAVAGVAAGW